MQRIILAVASVLVSSCALAPLTSTKNARSLGKGNWEINSGLSPAFTFTAGRGMTDAFDLGATLEFALEGTTALWGKYSFSESNAPSALALYGGGFDSSGGRGFFLGPVVDFQARWFQAYLIPKYNYVDWDISRSKANESSSIIDFFADGLTGSHHYMQMVLGTNFWFTKGFGLNLNAYFLHSLSGSSRLEFKNDALGGAELMFRF